MSVSKSKCMLVIKVFFGLAIALMLFSGCKGNISDDNQSQEKDTTPPAEVKDITATVKDKTVSLSWTNPNDDDFVSTQITFTPEVKDIAQPIVIQGEANKTSNATINELENDIEYAFILKTIDSNNNMSQGIKKTVTPKKSKVFLNASLPNDNGETIILTNDKAPIKIFATSTEKITKAVWKKNQTENIFDANDLLSDNTAINLSIESEILTFDVTENGFYDIAVQNIEGACNIIQAEIKTIDKTPLAEVENINTSFDGENVYVTWKDSTCVDKYDSPLKNVKLTYVYNDDETDSDNGEIFITSGEEKASIKIADGKNETTFMRITIQTIDELGNISQGNTVQENSYKYITCTAADVEEKIKNMTESGIVVVTGECDLSSIKKALDYLKNNKPTVKISLDLSKTTDLIKIDNSAFIYCSNLKNIILPDSVTSIGTSAFASCSNLNAITIPDSLKSIGNSAFAGCSALTEINIPDSITSIGNSTFSGSGLTGITIPNNTTSIGDKTFAGCSNLTSISIPNSVTSIGIQAFENCSNLTSLSIPSSVTNIGYSAFENCNNIKELYFIGNLAQWCSRKWDSTISSYDLFIDGQKQTNITIPDSITNINNGTFSGCTSLIHIIIPDSVTNIGDYAFYSCTNLTSIIIPDTVTNIGMSAFANCSNLSNITLPKNLQKINMWCFTNCLKLTSIDIHDNITSIAGEAFSGCENLTDLKIGNGVESIGYFSFFKCSGLTSITIPNSVTSIGGGAFAGCSSLEEISIPFVGSSRSATTGFSSIFSDTNSIPESLTKIIITDGITVIKDSAFSNCSTIKNIIIPDTVTKIGNSAFSDCTNLTNISIPNNVTSIGASAFAGCSSLTNISIPSNVTSIGASAFKNCSNLTNIIIGNGVNIIEDYAFDNCSSLTSITIPENVTNIGKAILSKCSSLEEITIPFVGASIDDSIESESILFGYIFGEGKKNTVGIGQKLKTGEYIYYEIPSSLKKVTVIGGKLLYGAFYGCSNLTSIIIPENITNIGDYAFSGCSSLTSIIIPETVTNIGEYAFSDCSGFTIIIIPDKVTNIGKGAFSNCSNLTSIIIPDKVTSIGERAFSSCSNLTSIIIPDKVTSIGNNTFYSCSKLSNVIIGEGVRSIGQYAFFKCPNLKNVTFTDIESTWYKTKRYDYTGGSSIGKLLNSEYNAALLKEEKEDYRYYYYNDKYQSE